MRKGLQTSLICASGIAVCLHFVSLAAPAHMGVAFAEVYRAFTPLFALHRAYADYLFLGVPVRPPAGVPAACEEIPPQLDLLRAELLVQTGSAEVVALLGHVQAGLSAFCQEHLETLDEIASMDELGWSLLQEAADAGLFARVGELEEALNNAFDKTVSGFEPDRQWRFSVAFAMRTLLEQGEISRLDPALVEILLGSERSPPPPADLPASLSEHVRALAGFCGRDLSPAEREEAIGIAARIEAALVEGG
jgi:hypothetical protein